MAGSDQWQIHTVTVVVKSDPRHTPGPDKQPDTIRHLPEDSPINRPQLSPSLAVLAQSDPPAHPTQPQPPTGDTLV